MATWKKIPWADEVAILTNTLPAAITEDSEGAVGTATDAARADHEHPSPADWTPKAHATAHENGGADEISVDGLSGVLAEAQTPAAHATSHKNGGADEVLLNELGEPTAAVDFNKQAANNLVIENAASKATPAKGQVFLDTDDDHLYVCTVT